MTTRKEVKAYRVSDDRGREILGMMPWEEFPEGGFASSDSETPPEAILDAQRLASGDCADANSEVADAA